MPLLNMGGYHSPLHRLRGFVLEKVIIEHMSVEGALEHVIGNFKSENTPPSPLWINCCKDFMVLGLGDKNYSDFAKDFPERKRGIRVCSKHKKELLNSITEEFNIEDCRIRFRNWLVSIEARGFSISQVSKVDWNGVEMLAANIKQWDAFYYNPTTDKCIAIDIKTGTQGRTMTPWRWNHILIDKTEDHYIFNLTYNIITKTNKA